MQTNNRILDDLAKVANGAVSTLVGVKSEIEASVRQQLERLLSEMDLVPREEFDAMKAVAIAARTEQEKQEKRIAALEAQIANLGRPKFKVNASKAKD
ncbi:MAG: accessory factor UbiK family protein [Rhodospirillales bacterium]|nr:accessory factor UbiK family protein [Rhodospirillales bacterium]